MAITKVIQGEDLMNRLSAGVNIIGDAVGATLGCNGRNVLIPETDHKKIGKHKVTKDGVSVARSIANLDDKISNIAAQMIKDVAGAAHKSSGDGTTTATVLAQAIFNNGIAYLKSNPKANPIELNKGIQWATQKVVEFIKEKAIHIENDSAKLTQVATVASNGDEEIGRLVGEAMADLGKEGVISVEVLQNGLDTYYEPTLGFEIISGYITDRFINNKEAMSCDYSNVLVLLCEDKITLFRDLLPALEIAESLKRPLLIICENVEGEGLSTINVNMSRNNNVCAIRIPALSDKKLDLLADIQAIVGGTIFSHTVGIELINCVEGDLGGCESCIVTKYGTALFGGQGTKENTDQRIAQLKKQLSIADSDSEMNWINQRLTTLQTKHGAIYVGGQSDIEKKELADRIDDAVCACKSAMEEGILPGGGTIFIKHDAYDWPIHEGDFLAGARILKDSIWAPFSKIISNSGLDQNIFEKEDMLKIKSMNMGYNARTNQWENLIESGIIDPAKVVRVALESAASIAGTLLTTTCGVYYE